MQDGPEEAEAPPSPDGDGDDGGGEAVELAPDPEEEAHRRWRALGARIATLQAVLRKKAAQAERSQLLASLQQLPCLASITERAMECLCELGVRRTYGSGELLLADPPHADLGSASSSERVVGLICGGEAQLVGAIASHSTTAATAGTAAAAGGIEGSLPPQPAGRRGASPTGRQAPKAQVTKAAAEEGEPMSEEPPPPRRTVLAYVLRGAGRLLPVATLGYGEVLHAGLLTEPGARCCLRVPPRTSLELVLLPRKAFLEALGGTERAAEIERAAARASFFGARLLHATSTVAALSHTVAPQTPGAAAAAPRTARAQGTPTVRRPRFQPRSPERPPLARGHATSSATALPGLHPGAAPTLTSPAFAPAPALAQLPSLPRAPPRSSLGAPWPPPHADAATGAPLAASVAASLSAPRLAGPEREVRALRTLTQGDSAPALRHILRSTWVPTQEAERSGKEAALTMALTPQQKQRAPGAGVGTGAGAGAGAGAGEGAPAPAAALSSLGRGWLAVHARMGPGPGVAAIASTESGGSRGLKVDAASGCYLNVPSIVPPAWMELFEADQI